MINLLRLIDLLPSYFRDYDTYKDKNEKGVLERFLELIGESIVDDSDRNTSMLPNITNILDMLNVENTRAVILDYLYEFIGSPIQEYKTPSVEGEYLHNPPYYVWYLEYNVPLMDYTKLGYVPETTYRAVKYYTAIDRKLIRYSISLYKIRGTEKFYNVILGAYFRLNGYTLTEENLMVAVNSKTRYDTQLPYDSSFLYDGDSTDCKACSNYIIDLTNYSSQLKPDEKIRLKKALSKYSPINVNLQVAYAFVQLNITLDGPEIEPGMITYSGEGQVVSGYETTVFISMESNIIFMGWYDSNGNLLSKGFTYTFLITESMALIIKYERDDL